MLTGGTAASCPRLTVASCLQLACLFASQHQLCKQQRQHSSSTKQSSMSSLHVEGLVDDKPLRNTNHLTYNRVYSKIGSNQVLRAEPAVLHFGGFQIGKLHKQRLRIRNAAGYSTRLSIIQPTTPYFKATCIAKKGSLAAGLSEEVEVEFVPTEWRYYYDCVRIHAEDDSILVPIHAYPSMNQTKFPALVDFGCCAIGDVVSKVVTLDCKIPIEFEFRIVELLPNINYKVEPLEGCIPANSSMDITITFCPSRFATEELKFEVHVAELNSSPITCTATGSGFPGLATQRMLREACSVQQPESDIWDNLSGNARMTLMTNDKSNSSKKGPRGDAYTQSMQQQRDTTARSRDCRRDGPIHLKLPNISSSQAVSTSDPSGIDVPWDLASQAKVSYVLNQKPGKLRLTDIKAAISVKKATLEEQQQELQSILAVGSQQCTHPFDLPSLPSSLKQALFHFAQQQHTEGCKAASLSISSTHVGEDLLSPTLTEEIQKARQQALKQCQQQVEETARHRMACEASTNGALHVSCSQEGMSAQEVSEGFVPTFQVSAAVDWKKRVQVLQKFVLAVRKVVYQTRAEKRLQRLRTLLRQLDNNKSRVAGELAQLVMASTVSSKRPGAPPTQLYNPEKVITRSWPVYHRMDFVEHAIACEPPVYTDFEELEPFEMKEPLEYKCLGHTLEDQPPYTSYVPPCTTQHMMSGAMEEQPLTSVEGDIKELHSHPCFSDRLLENPFATLEVAARYFNQVFNMPRPSWGTDLHSKLQPQMLDAYNSLQSEDHASMSIRSLKSSPLLSEKCLPRKDAWQVEPTQLPTGHITPVVNVSTSTSSTADSKSPPQPTLDCTIPGSAQEYAMQAWQLPRTRHHHALDASKQQEHESAVTSHAQRIDEYNTLLLYPCINKIVS